MGGGRPHLRVHANAPQTRLRLPKREYPGAAEAFSAPLRSAPLSATAQVDPCPHAYRAEGSDGLNLSARGPTRRVCLRSV